jgi:uncharacterized FlaG/YvyC family protein
MDISSLASLPAITPGPLATSAAQPVQESPAVAPIQSNAQPPVTASPASPTPEKVAQTVNQVNDSFAQRGLNLYATFEKDKATGIDVVKIVDKKTNETVNQIPIKEILAFAQSLDQQHGVRGKLLNATA